MKVLVTGGAGFIGSNLVFALISGGHEVLVVDDLSAGRVENIDPRAEFRRLDILDADLSGTIAAYSPQAVVHLAAQASVPASIKDPVRDRMVNVDGTVAVARAARDAGARRMISASSAAVYGEPEMLPLPESAAKRPQSPYGESKLAAEVALAAELSGTDTDFASFRFANVYGPRQDAAGEGGVVAIFCDRLRRQERPLIFGDGNQTRDFIYVGDVVNAILSALGSHQRLAGEGPDGAAFNISTGTRTSITQLLTSLRAVARYFGPQDHAEARGGDIVHSALDPSKAQRTFGWSAGVDIDTGVAATWRWFSGRP